MLPGLADVSATARSHKFVQMGLRGGQDPNENRFRLEIEQLARSVGYRYCVCVVPNRRRETSALVAGDVTSAHRRACEIAARSYATEADAEYDVLLLNAYPKDIDLIQAEGALVALKTASQPVVAEDGVLLITTAATEGLGTHGLFAPGGVSYRQPRQKRALGRREIWLYAPNILEQEARKLYWKGYPVFGGSGDLLRAMSERFPGRARLAVLPCAPIQQVVDRRHANCGE